MTVAASAEAPSRRDRLRAATKDEIIQTARRLLLRDGPGSVTLRAIAREMGMTAPGLYRYFGSHEELIRHVIADIFTELGTGISRAYPAENRGLQEEIAVGGLLLSQFWPDAPPQQRNFPMRNATMSGYGLATIVVEAGEHSGARIQARLAVEHGRPVILTSDVVERNAWAQALATRPGVAVAGSLRAVMASVSPIMSA